MNSASIPGALRRALRILLAPIGASLAVAWLGAGSCQVSYCSEDCDPCLRQCLCKNLVCPATQATFQATHALDDFETVEFAGIDGGVRRTFVDITGLSVQRAGGPALPGEDDVVRFARGVLAVNVRLFARPGSGSVFVLDSISAYETAWVVQFHLVAREPAGGSAGVQSFLFDSRGNLIEIDQTIPG